MHGPVWFIAWHVLLIVGHCFALFYCIRELQSPFAFRQWRIVWWSLIGVIGLTLVRRLFSVYFYIDLLSYKETVQVVTESIGQVMIAPRPHTALLLLDDFVIPTCTIVLQVIALYYLSAIVSHGMASLLRHDFPALILIDSQSVVLTWDNGAEELFGWSHTEALGYPIFDLIMPQRARDAHISAMQHFHEGRPSRVVNQVFVTMAVHKDGTEFPVELLVVTQRRENMLTFLGAVRRLR